MSLQSAQTVDHSVVLITDTTNPRLWIDIADNHQQTIISIQRKDAELRPAYNQAVAILDSYWAASGDICTIGPRCLNFYEITWYLLIAFAALAFIIVVILMVSIKVYDYVMISIILSLLGFLILSIGIPWGIYMRLRGQARATLHSSGISHIETTLAVARRIYMNPVQTYSERVVHYLANVGKRIIVPRHYPSFEYFIITNPIILVSILKHYSNIRKRNRDDALEYLTCVFLLAIIDECNTELVDVPPMTEAAA